MNAEAIVQSLMLDECDNRKFSITSKEGEGPAQDAQKWKALFDSTLAVKA